MKKNTKKVFTLIVLIFFTIKFEIFPQNNEEQKFTKDFQVEKNELVPHGVNPFYNLAPGYTLKLEGNEDGKPVILIIKVLNETKKVDGIETAIVEEKETHNGSLVEISKNYFAISKKTNCVYYFGEDVDIYKNNKITGHGGSWLSGKDGAKFGLIMPGIILLGSKYYQEVAPSIALDRAEIISTNEILKTKNMKYYNCIETEETTPIEPGTKEYKIYAPGIGLIQDGALKLIEAKQN